MFVQCSGNSVISSCIVCITLLNSGDVRTMRSTSISQILVLPDITDVIVLSISPFFLCPRHFPRFTTVSPMLHTVSTTLITPPTVIILDPTESRPWLQNHAQGHGHGMVFFPKSCVECILRENLLFGLFFSHSLILKWIMDLNMLRSETFIGFIYTIQINRPCPLREHQ